jgi:hypothetical protein
MTIGKPQDGLFTHMKRMDVMRILDRVYAMSLSEFAYAVLPRDFAYFGEIFSPYDHVIVSKIHAFCH